MATNTVATPASFEPIDRGGFLTGLGTPAVMLMMLAMIVLPFAADGTGSVVHCQYLAVDHGFDGIGLCDPSPRLWCVPHGSIAGDTNAACIECGFNASRFIERIPAPIRQVVSSKPLANLLLAAVTRWVWCCSPFWS